MLLLLPSLFLNVTVVVFLYTQPCPLQMPQSELSVCFSSYSFHCFHFDTRINTYKIQTGKVNKSL